MGAPRVLVVEDDRTIQDLLDVSFELEGFETRFADDGVGGLAAVAEFGPDVIVSDVMMPNMSGTEMLGKLRADPATAGIPVLLLSARAQTADIEAGLAAGAEAYMTKPFEPLELVDKVKELLAARSRQA